MNDQERLKVLLDTLQQLDGLDAERFQRLTAELQRHRNRDGCDEQERLKVTLFDAKSYDIDSFERHNNGRHAIRYVAASLNRDTVRAAAGSKVVCIFVNDTCTASVMKALASLGVELIALRCAGFNHVDLKACQVHDLSVVHVPAYSPYAVA